MYNLDKIVLSHFKQNGITLYRSNEKYVIRTNSYGNYTKSGKIVKVLFPSFYIYAFVDNEIKQVIIGEDYDEKRLYSHVFYKNPEDAKNLLGLNKEAKERIASWERCISWKEGDIVDKYWDIFVECYIYSTSQYNPYNNKQDCLTEIFINGDDIISFNISDNKLSFKDNEGFIHFVEIDFES